MHPCLTPPRPKKNHSTHPSTRLLEEVFASIAHFSGAGSCPKIIVADGVKIRDGDALGDCKFRSGSCRAFPKSRHTVCQYKTLL